MRKLMFVLTIVLASAAVVNAQDTSGAQNDKNDQYRKDQSMNENENMDQGGWNLTDRDRIATSQLPSSVRRQIQGPEYTGWSVRNAFKRMSEDRTTYGVELSKGDQMKKLRFDSQGNLIPEKTKRNREK